MLHHALAIGFLVRGCASALAGYLHIAQVQVNAAGVQVSNTGIAHCGQNAAQIRVAGKKSGFHQRRMRHRIGHLAAFGSGFTAFYRDGDELGGAFAIAHDGLGQLAGNVKQGAAQGLAVGTVQRSHSRMRGLLAGNQHKRIVGGGVAIDRDAVEGAFSDFLGQLLEQSRSNAGIGRHKTQHGGHVGPDHASALGNAGDCDHRTAG